jgi:hypothetical protein
MKLVMDALPYSANNLVNTVFPIDPGWGFQDGAYMTGDLLMASCIAYRGYIQLAEMALAVSSTAIYNACIAKAALMKAAINSTFYVASGGKYYMKASTIICKDQFDVCGTCFAVYLGILDTTKSNLISNYIISIINECTYQGAVKHVPTSFEFDPGVWIWEYCAPFWTYGQYQNGAAWATPLAWFLYVINLNNKKLAVQTFETAYAANESLTIPEWYSSTDIGELNYSTSQSVFSLAKDILLATNVFFFDAIRVDNNITTVDDDIITVDDE